MWKLMFFTFSLYYSISTHYLRPMINVVFFHLHHHFTPAFGKWSGFVCG